MNWNLFTYIKAVRAEIRRRYEAYCALRRNARKQIKQTHLHQKKRGIRPPNPFARRTMLFKRIHNIEG